jgi:hypothetical protein
MTLHITGPTRKEITSGSPYPSLTGREVIVRLTRNKGGNLLKLIENCNLICNRRIIISHELQSVACLVLVSKLHFSKSTFIPNK